MILCVVYLSVAICPVGSLARKLTVSSDHRSLTINELCKNCHDEGDLQVIQCNASNKYGYVLGQGYINVFGSSFIFLIQANECLFYWFVTCSLYSNQRIVSFSGLSFLVFYSNKRIVCFSDSSFLSLFKLSNCLYQRIVCYTGLSFLFFMQTRELFVLF